MTEKEKTEAEAFYDLGVAMRKLSQAMSENWLAFLQGTHSMEKFNDQFTYKQRFAFWILDTAERFAEWLGGEHD
jgi:hypothetical protein